MSGTLSSLALSPADWFHDNGQACSYVLAVVLAKPLTLEMLVHLLEQNKVKILLLEVFAYLKVLRGGKSATRI